MLRELIEWLEQQDGAKVVPHGFGAPHSYRGYYEDVAFEPAQNVTFAFMLENAKAALGATFQGYKGGEYTMHGIIRGSRGAYLVLTDTTGRYGWWSLLHPTDVTYLPPNDGGNPRERSEAK